MCSEFSTQNRAVLLTLEAEDGCVELVRLPECLLFDDCCLAGPLVLGRTVSLIVYVSSITVWFRYLRAEKMVNWRIDQSNSKRKFRRYRIQAEFRIPSITLP